MSNFKEGDIVEYIAKNHFLGSIAILKRPGSPGEWNVAIVYLSNPSLRVMNSSWRNNPFFAEQNIKVIGHVDEQ